jgi:hypothetical protein
VSRAWTAFKIVLAGQAALAGAATLWSGHCGACRTGASWLALAGFALYASLLAAALARGPSPLVFSGALFAAGVHAVLALHLWLGELGCGLCASAAAGAAGLAALAVACDRRNLSRGAAVLPWAVLAAVAATGWPRPAAAAGPSPEGASVRLTVFAQDDCPYCEDLRRKVLPDIEKEFGPRLRVIWRAAAELPAVRRTPTVVVAPERNGRAGRVFEGLPSVSALREAIREAEARP